MSTKKIGLQTTANFNFTAKDIGLQTTHVQLHDEGTAGFQQTTSQFLSQFQLHNEGYWTLDNVSSTSRRRDRWLSTNNFSISEPISTSQRRILDSRQRMFNFTTKGPLVVNKQLLNFRANFNFTTKDIGLQTTQVQLHDEGTAGCQQTTSQFLSQFQLHNEGYWTPDNARYWTQDNASSTSRRRDRWLSINNFQLHDGGYWTRNNATYLDFNFTTKDIQRDKAICQRPPSSITLSSEYNLSREGLSANQRPSSSTTLSSKAYYLQYNLSREGLSVNQRPSGSTTLSSKAYHLQYNLSLEGLSANKRPLNSTTLSSKAYPLQHNLSREGLSANRRPSSSITLSTEANQLPFLLWFDPIFRCSWSLTEAVAFHSHPATVSILDDRLWSLVTMFDRKLRTLSPRRRVAQTPPRETSPEPTSPPSASSFFPTRITASTLQPSTAHSP
ncbi:hypothetical protein F3Y22_tig00004378pilonHSYRG00007 [Hibiscus syriacus]|uniref:Uncharacterized protein n=1 Tax=Hibiscus syriacus TaxID=106335 RepID=A0A6A3CMX9_HIBSY|nr:hypothetical protein F3Y22_tig00004378pilonHSYRG00007 [Hibiscus syriacus]